MTRKLDKTEWKRVTMGEVAAVSKERVDPSDGSVERFIAGEHMETDDMQIHRWGHVGDVDLGPAFHRRFRPGQVLYGSRRTYLRKVAVAEFDGVCANTTFVVKTKDQDALLQQFLPFVMTAEPFHAFAIAESKGSVNPYVNWSDIERYEFDLPPLENQNAIADLLWAAERQRFALKDEVTAVQLARTAAFRSWVSAIPGRTTLGSQFHVQLGKMLSQSSQPTKDDPGLPYLANVNVRWDGFDCSGLRHVRLNPREREQFLLRVGDILVCEGGEIGRAAVWDGQLEECYYQKALHRLRPTGAASLHGSLLVAYLRLLADDGRLGEYSTGTTFAHLTRERLIDIDIPSVGVADALAGQAVLRAFDRALTALSNELSAVTALCASFSADVFGGN